MSQLVDQQRRIAQSIKNLSIVAPGLAQVPAMSDGALVIDISGSMASGKKMEAAKAAAAAFADDKALRDPKGRLALIKFDDRVEEVVDFTVAKDVEPIKAGIKTFSARGGTDMPLALAFVSKKFSPASEGRPRFVVILTDGHSVGDPIAAVQPLKSAGVDVFAVGFGESPGDVDPRLPQVADPGRYFFCNDLASLMAQFKAISRQTSGLAIRPQLALPA